MIVLLSPPMPDPPLYGYVSRLEGQAWAVGLRRNVPLQVSSPVGTQDRIRFSPGGRIVILRYADWEHVRLAFDARKNPAPLPSAAGTGGPIKRLIHALGVPGLNYRRVAQAWSRPGVDPAPDCFPAYPRGMVLDSPAEVRWRGAAPKGVVVTLGSPVDRGVGRSYDVAEGASSFRWPAGEIRFKPDCRYLWRVQPGNAAVEIVSFTVLDPARAERVRQDLKAVDECAELEPGERALLKVQVLMKSGLYADSLSALDGVGADVGPSLRALLQNEAWQKLAISVKGVSADLQGDELVRQWGGE